MRKRVAKGMQEPERDALTEALCKMHEVRSLALDVFSRKERGSNAFTQFIKSVDDVIARIAIIRKWKRIDSSGRQHST